MPHGGGVTWEGLVTGANPGMALRELAEYLHRAKWVAPDGARSAHTLLARIGEESRVFRALVVQARDLTEGRVGAWYPPAYQLVFDLNGFRARLARALESRSWESIAASVAADVGSLETQRAVVFRLVLTALAPGRQLHRPAPPPMPHQAPVARQPQPVPKPPKAKAPPLSYTPPPIPASTLAEVRTVNLRRIPTSHANRRRGKKTVVLAGVSVLVIAAFTFAKEENGHHNPGVQAGELLPPEHANSHSASPKPTPGSERSAPRSGNPTPPQEQPLPASVRTTGFVRVLAIDTSRQGSSNQREIHLLITTATTDDVTLEVGYATPQTPNTWQRHILYLSGATKYDEIDTIDVSVFCPAPYVTIVAGTNPPAGRTTADGWEVATRVGNSCG